jgi:hypothetical protein
MFNDDFPLDSQPGILDFAIRSFTFQVMQDDSSLVETNKKNPPIRH